MGNWQTKMQWRKPLHFCFVLLSYSLTLLHLEFQVLHRQLIVDQLPQRINPDFKMR